MPHCDVKPFFCIYRDESDDITEIEEEENDWSSPPASPTPEETPQALDKIRDVQENEFEDLDEIDESSREADDHGRFAVNVTPPEETESSHTP